MPHTVPTRRSTGGFPRSILFALLIVAAVPAFGQIDLLREKSGGGPAVGGQVKSQRKLAVETTLMADRLEAGATATLAIEVSIPDGFHLYSMDPGYSGRTKINLTETPGLKPLSEFEADHPPKRAFDETLEQEVEKYTGRVTWKRSFEIVDPIAARADGSLIGTYCGSGIGGVCLRANEPFAATLTQAATPPAGASAANFTKVETPQVGDAAGPATLRFSLAPENAGPGDTVTLSATMTLAGAWHTYAVTQPKAIGAQPTVFKLEKAKGLTPYGEAFVADQAPERKTLETEEGSSPIEQHGGTVTWTRQFRVDDAAYGVEGSIRYVTCDDERCLQPKTVAFALGSLDGAGAVPAALPALETPTNEVEVRKVDTANLPLYLGLAFLGGLVLNVMPCVLPVVAIKVMSFVQQAGEDRGRVFVLNAVYAAGVVSVFLFLAALAALPEWFGVLFRLLGLETGEFSWGGLFQSDRFNAIMAVIVFAMALSLLGVFEIPIPGMIGSAAGATQREGLSGAFLTGVFTTLLATPCTGPFMTSTLTWSVKQPPSVTFLVWAVMGVGMASPYLVFGLVPGAVKLLPRPGNWMIHFKQFAGFVLMATVVFLMVPLKTDHLLPLLVALLGVALALWMIGLVQPSTSATKRRVVSTAGLVLGGAVAAFAYTLTAEPTHKLAWEPFSTERVNVLVAEKKPVLIDFTADWCAICKYNERNALNTQETKALVEERGVATLVADFTDESQEIRRWLDRYGSISVPLTVIIPPGRPDEPIVLDGLYTQGTLLEKLEEAARPAAVAISAVKTAGTR